MNIIVTRIDASGVATIIARASAFCRALRVMNEDKARHPGASYTIIQESSR